MSTLSKVSIQGMHLTMIINYRKMNGGTAAFAGEEVK